MILRLDDPGRKQRAPLLLFGARDTDRARLGRADEAIFVALFRGALLVGQSRADLWQGEAVNIGNLMAGIRILRHIRPVRRTEAERFRVRLERPDVRIRLVEVPEGETPVVPLERVADRTARK